VSPKRKIETSSKARELTPFLVMEILGKAHVGVTPGIDFGPNAEGYLRFSYANSLENIPGAWTGWSGMCRKIIKNQARQACSLP